MSTGQFTAEEFVAAKFDLPEGGRWTELEGGSVACLDPPDDRHGTVMLNLSKALALAASYDRVDAPLPRFELGLIVRRNPDTVRYPDVSFTVGGFDDADHPIAEAPPQLVVEIASTRDRRRAVVSRVQDYLEWGVEAVWVFDTVESEVHLCRGDQRTKKLREFDTLYGTPHIEGLRIKVGDVFKEPDWWTG